MALNKAEKVLREIESVARENFLPIIGPGKGKILAEIVRKVKPKRVLEIGTLIGYSAILIGKELVSDACLITIEVNPYSAKTALHNIKRSEIPPKVKVLVGDAVEIIPKLEGTFDLVFIDADKWQYLEYLRLVEDKLREGSVVVADNVEQAPHYLEYVRSSGKYASRYVLADWDGLEVSFKL
ncbi:MAG: O-methyltransferase [Candidatus Bathyarchaeia archaeon]